MKTHCGSAGEQKCGNSDPHASDQWGSQWWSLQQLKIYQLSRTRLCWESGFPDFWTLFGIRVEEPGGSQRRFISHVLPVPNMAIYRRCIKGISLRYLTSNDHINPMIRYSSIFQYFSYSPVALGVLSRDMSTLTSLLPVSCTPFLNTSLPLYYTPAPNG